MLRVKRVQKQAQKGCKKVKQWQKRLVKGIKCQQVLRTMDKKFAKNKTKNKTENKAKYNGWQ